MALLFLGQAPSAQSLTYALFERYVDALREQARIPGMAAAIVRDGRPAPEWERGFGLAVVEGAVPATPSTPFPVSTLSQVIGATLVLRHCVDTGEVQFADLVRRWSPGFAEPRATFADVLSHRIDGSYSHEPGRFASALTGAAEECGDRPYANLMFEQIIARFGMAHSVPGADVAIIGSPVRRIFPTPDLRRLDLVLRDLAQPYRVNGDRRAIRSTSRVPTLSAGNGLIASAHDLALFDAALDSGAIVSPRTLQAAWRPQPGAPTGYGWFVQRVNNRRVVWQFGEERNAYSSMIIKLPDHGLTLIMLANSDGLTAPFPLAEGDITASPFAKIFFGLLG